MIGGGVVAAAAGIAYGDLIATDGEQRKSVVELLLGGALMFHAAIGGTVLATLGMGEVGRGATRDCVDLDHVFDDLPERDLPDDE